MEHIFSEVFGKVLNGMTGFQAMTAIWSYPVDGKCWVKFYFQVEFIIIPGKDDQDEISTGEELTNRAMRYLVKHIQNGDMADQWVDSSPQLGSETFLFGNITDDEYSLSFFSSMKGYVWNRTPVKMQRLLVPKFRKTTMSLWFLFFSVAFLYYGLVLLTTTLKLMDDDSGGARKNLDPSTVVCLAHNSPDLTNADYRDITLSAFSELPGMISAMVCIDTLGRKKSMILGFVVAAVCFIPVMQSAKRDVITAFLAIARSSSMAAFTVLFAYCSEVYPTQIRGTGVGVSNTFSRFAGMIVPLFAVDLVRNGAEEFVLFLFGFIAIVSAFVVSRLERETKGQHLDASTETEEESFASKESESAGVELSERTPQIAE